jgi:hypothetical protein
MLLPDPGGRERYSNFTAGSGPVGLDTGELADGAARPASTLAPRDLPRSLGAIVSTCILGGDRAETGYRHLGDGLL